MLRTYILIIRLYYCSKSKLELPFITIFTSFEKGLFLPATVYTAFTLCIVFDTQRRSAIKYSLDVLNTRAYFQIRMFFVGLFFYTAISFSCGGAIFQSCFDNISDAADHIYVFRQHDVCQ